MASVVKDPGGRKRILFFGIDGTRKALRIGKCTMAKGEAFKAKVESLIVARLQGSIIGDETARWVADLPDRMHSKLVAAGLVDARVHRSVAALLSVGDLCDQFIADRDDVRSSTRWVYKLTAANLVDFFGRDKLIGTITAYDAEQWRRAMTRGDLSKGRLKGKPLAEATIRKRTGVIKQLFSVAMKRHAISENPFAGLKSSAIANEKRRYFLSREDAQKVLDACPDAEWRLIFALARFGGLRTPSETLSLKWSDINGDRMVIHSIKTEHHEGKGVRVVPLFPELKTALDDVFDQAEPGNEYVIVRRRMNSQNLRTGFLEIVKRAGLKPWPKIFQNLRSTRETELAEVYPLHVVVAWLGNSQLVAAKHYLQVTNDHFKQAVQAAQNPAQSTPTSSGKPEQVTRDDCVVPAELQGTAAECHGLPPSSVDPSGA